MRPDSPIAVVGLGGVFPGARDVGAFWRNIVEKIDACREVPAERWVVDPVRACSRTVMPDRVLSRRAGLIEPFAIATDGLDVDREMLAALDPLYHLVLHAGRAAWLDAQTHGLDLRRVGVILAAIALPTDSSSALSRELFGRDFERRLFELAGRSPPQWKGQTDPINARVTGLPAAILARALRLGGGSYTLDAACASSLYALKLGCDELAAGRLDAVLAGGVSRPDCLYTQMGFSQLRSLSPSGRCAPFDATADGLVVGEGAGILLLRRLEDAQREGDRVYGVIRGIGLSNDIGGSLLAPDSEGQLRAMRESYRQAGWSPETVDLIECHGTGTPTGDAVEIASLKALWSAALARRRPCAIGSVKSMIGHLLTGAGAAGLIKVLGALRHGMLPPSLNCERPAAGLADSPFAVQTRAEKWESPADGRSRRAAVSAFGFGGINAHVLVEEWNKQDAVSSKGRVAVGPKIAESTSRAEPVAVIGMDAQFGRIQSLPEFAEAVLNGESVIEPRPDGRWRGISESPDAGQGGSYGAYLDQLRIGVGEFRLPPNEVPELLPQQFVMMQSAAAAMRDAGILQRDRRPRMGAVIGLSLDMETNDFDLRWWLERQARVWAGALGLHLDDRAMENWLDRMREAISPALNAARTAGALGGMIASRIAREFALGGPCFCVSADETSGLRALEVAVRALQQGAVDAVLVGAVDMSGDPRAVHAAGGQDAQSWCPADGAASVVLKRLADAQRDGNRVYASIRGVGAASPCGSGAETHRIAMERAYSDADVDASATGLLEIACPPADLNEALNGATELLSDRAQPIALGRISDCIGHAGAATGMAALVKAICCLHDESLPPALNPSSAPSTQGWHGQRYSVGRVPETSAPSQTPFDDPSGLFHVPRQPLYWLRDREDGPRRAEVSARTPDGQWMHVLVEAIEPTVNAHASARRHRPNSTRSAIFAVFGEDATAIRSGLARLSQLATGDRAGVDDLARHWYAQCAADATKGRALAIHAASLESLRQRLRRADELLAQSPEARIDGREEIYYAPDPLARGGQLAFVFPGSGNHFLGMGQGLFAAWPHVLRELDDRTARLASHLMPRWFAPYRADWSEGWEQRAHAAIAQDPRRMIFGQVSFGVVMAELLRHMGVRPDAVIGYSLGESAGLFALGAWPDRDEMFRRMSASTLFSTDLAGPCNALRAAWAIPEAEQVDWHAVVIPRSADQVRAALSSVRFARLMIVNTPGECVVGGLRADVEAVSRKLGCRAVPLDGVPTVHFEAVQQVEQAYRELHDLEATPPDGVRFYSAAIGRSYAVDRASAAESITRQALEGFDFPRLIRQAWDDGVRLFVELGPQGSCTRMIGRILGDLPHLARTASVRGEDEPAGVLRLLAELIAEGVRPDLGWLYGVSPDTEPALDVTRSETPRAEIIVPVGRPAPVPCLPDGVESETEPPSSGPSDGRSEMTPAAFQPSASVFSPEIRSVHNARPPVQKAALTPAAQLANELIATTAATAKAHDAYLRFSQRATRELGDMLVLQAQLLETALNDSSTIPDLAATVDDDSGLGAYPEPIQPIIRAPAVAKTPVAFTRALCMEFAVGSIAKVLGPQFAAVDAYPTRVRLPDEPLMLVDRILTVEGKKGSLTRGRLVTEHDVLPNAWYLDGGRAPVCITVEAGQADLFLSAYLGIDLATKGLRTYRLLDATVTFHRGLPQPAETIRYDITIDRFVRRGETYLFFFHFDGTIGGVPVLTMRNGCAGFFTAQEVANAGGIVLKREETEPQSGRRDPSWRELVPMHRETYTDGQVSALRRGDLAACFGPHFAGLNLRDPLRLPDGRMKLFDRVIELDPKGGRFGLGIIRTEADIHGDEWFLTCHFVDDMVMPGTLMYECCVHALRFFLLRMGWVAEQAGVCCEPVPGMPSALRCRGPVTPATRKVIYQVEIKELGYRPEPYVIADALMFADGERIVQMNDMSLKLSGVTREGVEALWSAERTFSRDPQGSAPSDADDVSHPISSKGTLSEPPAARTLFDRDRILAFAIGKPSHAFGEPYRIFDDKRRIARLPGPPLQFLDRIVQIEPEPWKLQPGGWITAEYDVPPDAWYFTANRQTAMPFAVLLEIALQPCGWLAAYLGSALRSETDLRFRNLGGSATLHREVFADSGTLSTRVRMTNVSEAGGMIIQEFEFHIRDPAGPIYDGVTQFGFFSDESLLRQVGIRNAVQRMYLPSAAQRAAAQAFSLDDVRPWTPDDSVTEPWFGAAMPARAFRMVDTVDLHLPDGGPHGLGCIQGSTTVDPGAWFFKAHFYQDPVWPGSLGLESFLQLLKAYARHRWPQMTRTHRFETIATGREHTWAYRGQIIPTNKRVEIAAEINKRDDGDAPIVVADGFLSVDGIPIYEMRKFGMRLVRV